MTVVLVDGLEIGDGMVMVFGDLLGAWLWNGVLEAVIEDVVVDVVENHDEDDDVSVDGSAIGGNASQRGDVLMWTMYLAGHSPASQLWPGVRGDLHFCGRQAMVKAPSPYINCFGRQGVFVEHDISGELSDR